MTHIYEEQCPLPFPFRQAISGWCMDEAMFTPDRNQQFKRIGKMRKLYLSKGWAVISIDAKKKELIGDFK